MIDSYIDVYYDDFNIFKLILIKLTNTLCIILFN